VSIDGVDQSMKPAIFPMVKKGSELRTRDGRAEVLLTPGVFLRMIDSSAIRMLETDLANTRVELLAGSATVEVDDPMVSTKNAPVTMVVGDAEIRVVRHGLIELFAKPGRVNVYDGQAEVAAGGATLLLKEGRYSDLGGELKAEKFNINEHG